MVRFQAGKVRSEQHGADQAHQDRVAHGEQRGRGEDEVENPIHRARAPPGEQHDHQRTDQHHAIAIGREPKGRILPFEVAGLDSTAAVEQHDLNDAEPVGIDRGGQEAGDGHEPQLALAFHRPFAQSLDQGFAAISAEHDPAHEVAAVAIGPEDEDRDQRPHPAAAFQNRHGDGEQYEGDEEGPALLEVDGHRAGGDRAREAAIEAGGAPPHHQSHQPAEDDAAAGRAEAPAPGTRWPRG